MNLPSYPNTKIGKYPWLGTFPAHWVVKRLRFATERIEQGWSPQCDNQAADDDAWGVMKVGCVNGDQFDASENKALPPELDAKTEYELRPGDVLISRANTRELVGSAAIVPSDVRSKLLLCDKLFRIELSPEIDAAYLTFCLRTPAARFQYEQDATGASGSMQNIGQDAIKNLVLPFPSYSEQQQIAVFLDWKTSQIDALIAKKQTLLQKLKEKRLAVITQAVTKGLNPDVPMRDSGIAWLGEVPSHWEVKPVKFLTRIVRGQFSHRPRNDPAFYDGEYPFVQTGDIARAGKFVTSYSQTLNERGLSVSRQFPAGTLVMTIAANIGDMAIIDFAACFPDSIVGFIPEEKIDLDFLYFMFIAMKQRLMMTAVLNTQLNLNIDRIASIETVAPPHDEQIRIVELLDAEVKRSDMLMEKAEEAITRLTEYRSALITAATTGKIDVRNVAIPAHA